MACEVATPEFHQTYDMEITEMVKESVRYADPNGGRCLVTNTEATIAVDYCHCIPREIMNDKRILDRLEWAWNMRRSSLNLDTFYNVFCISIDLRILFDQRRWLLIPDNGTLKKYRGSLDFIGGQHFAQRESFPKFSEQKTFLYRFVPLQNLEGLLILSQDDIPDGKLSPEHGSIHVYSFNKLPILESHLLPHFVIFDAGRKLADSEQNLIQNLVKIFPEVHFSAIMALYRAWIRPPPAKAQKDPSYNVPDDDSKKVSNEDKDHRTPPPPRPKKRKAPVVEDEEIRTASGPPGRGVWCPIQKNSC